jgi:acyl-CoA thioesterase-1
MSCTVRFFLVLVLALASPAALAERVILVFGDSLSSGYGLPAGQGWVSLLESRLREADLPYRVVNASISGETTLGGRNRIADVLAAHRPAVLVIELGANDGLRGQPLETTRENLAAMIRAAQRHRTAVLLVGMELPPNYGIAYTQKFRELYAGLAREHRARLVPFLMEGFAHDREMFQPDGIHPNGRAQPLMLENVWKELRPLLRARPAGRSEL